VAFSKFFTNHPASVGETYWQHFKFALNIFFSLLKAAFACLVHAILPPLFPSAASSEVRKLHQGIEARASESKQDNESTVLLSSIESPALQPPEQLTTL
jgi:hypothetical protein